MKPKSNLTLAILGVVVGTAVILTQTAWSDRHHPQLKLEGSWIAKGMGLVEGASWMYTIVPCDPSGRKAAFHGMVHRTDPTLFGYFPDAEYLSPLIGEAVITASDRAVFTVLYYGMKKGATGAEKVYIGLVSGTIKQLPSGKLELQHNSAIYLPGQDTDGDGLPDNGAPVASLSYPSLDTRLPIVPPYGQ